MQYKNGLNSHLNGYACYLIVSTAGGNVLICVSVCIFHLVACGGVFRVDWKEGHRTAFCHQSAVVLGCKPHWRHKHAEKHNSVSGRAVKHEQPGYPATHA